MPRIASYILIVSLILASCTKVKVEDEIVTNDVEFDDDLDDEDDFGFGKLFEDEDDDSFDEE